MSKLLLAGGVLIFLIGVPPGQAASATQEGFRFPTKDALVYKGPGACDEDCSTAAALMAEKAGLHPVYVGPTETGATLFDHAAVWIQPGGESRVVGRAMTEELKERIRDFVGSGGAYVGFCAGGFLATDRIGELKDAGLGLITGQTAQYDKIDGEAGVVTLQWDGHPRQLYWEGGPAFFPPTDGTAAPEVMATYPDGSAVTVRASFGKGRVYVTGVHPEAPQWWRDYFKLSDNDGLDYDLAVGMIQWAARLASDPSQHL